MPNVTVTLAPRQVMAALTGLQLVLKQQQRTLERAQAKHEPVTAAIARSTIDDIKAACETLRAAAFANIQV